MPGPECDMCRSEAGKRGAVERAKFNIMIERDGKVEIEQLCSACLRRRMLISVRDLQGELRIIVKPI